VSLPRVALTVAACCACLALPAGASALTGAAAVAELNAERASNGIPGDLVERRDWTAACAAHNHYMQLNHLFDPIEDPSRRGYTKQGAWAGRNAVLGWGTWTSGRNPWENAPLGLMPLLSPRLTQLGVSASYHHVCATTRSGYLRAAPGSPSLYSYPGDGAAGVPYRQWSYGLPVTPGDFVALPAGITTGPHLYVLADIDGQARMTEASVVGPSGPVDIRTVDNTVEELGGYLPTGGIMIPVSALEPGATYRASATVTIGSLTLTRLWSFTTALADPHTLLFVSSSLSFDASTQPPQVTQGSIAVRTSSPAPVQVTITGGGPALASRDLLDGERWTPPQTPGSFSVCGHQEATSYYGGYDRCQQLHIRDQASFSHPTAITLKAAIVGRMLKYKLTVRPARGRQVTLSARRLVNRRWHTFRTVVRDANRTLTRTITARPSDRQIQIVVTVPKVRVGAETYRAARLVTTIRR
jgi:hypothetical protein